VKHRLGKAAEDAGLPFRGSDKIYNSRLAQELGLWSETKNRGDEFHATVFRAYFVDGANIAKIPLLLELATSAGLPADEAAEILKGRVFEAAVDADWAISRERRITAVPTFIFNQDKLIGAQTYQALEALMERNGVYKKAAEN
jgi:predicted DsbA family dithiol-disulfide isomerase